MSTWKKVALLNGGWLIGIGISLLILPPNTPLWIWAMASVCVFAVLNWVFFIRTQRTTGERKIDPVRRVAAWMGVVFLLLELAFRYLRR